MNLKLLSIYFLLLFAVHVQAQDISAIANDFVNTLSPELKEQAMFPFKSDERFNMNFVPMIRKGPTFHEFNDKQKKASLELLRVSLSTKGYEKAEQIIGLEKVLAILEGESKLPNGRLRRDPLNYHFCIFGIPSPTSNWAWRFEGHHISQNFVISNGKIISSTPSFLGSNPAIVKSGEQKGKQVLKQEMELGFKLMNSLTPQQLKVAKVSESAPSEILTGNSRNIKLPDAKGIKYTALTETQKKIFDELLQVYVDNYQLGFSRTLMEKIRTAGIDNLFFAWAGGLEEGVGQYYSIQGPMLLIEYDNVQNNANHVHTVVRDLTNDYAEDILREHYEKEHR
jgi:hypothetical protein